MLRLVRSSKFDVWLSSLADDDAKVRVFARLRNAELGNFGDCAPVGEGISEMRIHVGAGYRIYFTRVGATIYLLLTGGNKSTQRRDIAEAKSIARQFRETKS